MSIIRDNFLLHFIQIISLVILLLIIFLIIKPGINSVEKEILSKKEMILSDFEKQYGIKISYVSLSPIIIDSLTLEGVNIETTHGLNRAYISKVTVQFNLINLLLSRWIQVDPQSFIKAIYLKSGDAVVDFENFEFISKFTSGKPNNRTLQIKFFLKNIDVKLNFKDLIINADDVWGRFESQLGRYLFDLKANVTYKTKNSTFFEYFSGNAKVNGSLSKNLKVIKSKTFLTNISSDIGVFSDLNAELNYINNEVFVKNIDKKSEFDYHFEYKRFLNELVFSLESESFTLQDFFEPSIYFNSLDKFKNSPFSGTLLLSYNLLNKEFTYSADGEVVINELYKPFPIKARFDLIGDLDYVRFNNLNLYTSKGSLGFNGGLDLRTHFPSGRVYIRDLEISEELTINSDLSLKVINSNFVSANFDFIETYGIKLNNLKSLIYVDEKDISIQGIKREDSGKINFTCNYDKITQKFTSSIDFDSFSTAFLKSLVDIDKLDNIISKSNLSLEAEIEYSKDKLIYNIYELVLEDQDNNTLLELEALGEQNTFSINYFNLSIDELQMQGRIDGKSVDDKYKLELDTLINDNNYQIDISLSDNYISATGNYGLDLKLYLGEDIYIDVKADEIPISYKNYNISPNFKLKAAIFNDKSFLLSIPYFETKVESKELAIKPTISFTADGNDNLIIFSNITYEDRFNPIEGSIKLKREALNLYSVIATLKSDYDEVYNLNSLLSLTDNNLTLDLNIRNILLDRLEIDGLTGRSSINIVGEGQLDSFKINGGLSSKDIIYNQKRIDLKLDFKMNEEYISFLNMNSQIDNIQFTIPLSTYNYKAGTILGKMDTLINLDAFKLESQMTLDFNIRPIKDITRINSSIFETINGQVNIKEFKSDEEILFSNKILRIFNNISALQIYSLDKNLKFRYSYSNGKIGAKLLKPYFMALSTHGIIKDGFIDLSVNDINMDGSVLDLFLRKNIYGEKDISIHSLDLRGELSLDGPIDNPMFNGLLWVDSKINVSYISEEINDIRMNIRLSDNRVNILPTEINIGDSSKILLNGEMLLDSWFPDSVVINLNIPIEYKIPVIYQYKTIVSDVNLYTPSLVYYLNNAGSFIIGKIIIEDGEFFTKNEKVTEPFKKSVEEDNTGFELDLEVEIGGNNQLYWPNKDFPVVEATLNPGDTVKVDLKSITGEYSILGGISIIEGEVDYSGNPFILSEGVVTLDITPEQADPYIKIVGTKTVIDSNDRQVEVILTYEGGFFSDFEPVFSSDDPSKTEEEINLLVGIAVIGDDPLESIAGALDIVSGTVTAPLEDAIKSIIPVDNVKIKSGFISSIYSNITKVSFDSDDESRYNLSTLVNNSSITLGSFVTNDFFVKGQVGAIYENEDLNQDLSLDINLGLTLYSPHFQLGFNLNPKLSDEYVFEPEIALSLDWVYNPRVDINKENK